MIVQIGLGEIMIFKRIANWVSDPVHVLNTLSVLLAGVGVGLLVERFLK
jgi:hypothetical protein